MIFFLGVGAVSLVILVVSMLKTRFVKNRKKPRQPLDTENKPEPAKQSKGEEKNKKTWEQQVKRWWLIIIVVVPLTWVVGKVIWTATYHSISSTFGIKAVSPPKAFYSWKKLNNQYGYNPAVRQGGPFSVTITTHTEEVLNFQFSTSAGVYNFYGYKTGDTGDKFKGKWTCDRAPGGDWELHLDLDRSRGTSTERYIGTESDSCIPEGKPSELLIIK